MPKNCRVCQLITPFVRHYTKNMPEILLLYDLLPALVDAWVCVSALPDMLIPMCMYWSRCVCVCACFDSCVSLAVCSLFAKCVLKNVSFAVLRPSCVGWSIRVYECVYNCLAHYASLAA